MSHAICSRPFGYARRFGGRRLAGSVGAGALVVGLTVVLPVMTGAVPLAGAEIPAAGDTVDLLSEANIRLDGAAALDRAGTSVAVAGDVNNDGADDVILGVPGTDNLGLDSGSAYVIYGSTTEPTTPLDLATLTTTNTTRGFRIDGAASYASAGIAVAGAGDVNNDGLDDVIIGASQASNNNRLASGSVYVVYGSTTEPTTPLDLATLTTTNTNRGFRIDGAATFDNAGTSVAGAGDVNNDGLNDVIIGAPQANNNNRDYSGSVYVVYGSTTEPTIPLDLATLTTTNTNRGFRIDGAESLERAGDSMAVAGDVNIDGADDVIIGAIGASNNGRDYSGSVYVVYGSTTEPTTPLDLATLTTTNTTLGFRIDGAAAGDATGCSVAGAGDVNKDGTEDLIIGARNADNKDGTFSGSAYVIYGSAANLTTPLDLATLTTTNTSRGFRIDGAASFDNAGTSVAGAGDVNDDGADDVVVGAPQASNNSGSAFVVYGSTTSPATPLDLATLTTTNTARGFRIDGAAEGDFAGTALAGAGDVNNDGADDVIIGATETDNNSRNFSGSAYVIYGSVNDAPVAVDDSYSTAEDTALSVETPGVLGNDTDTENDALSAEVVADPIHGDVVLSSDGSFTYTPETDYSGVDSFTYRAADASKTSDPATVELTVVAAPAITDIAPSSGPVAGGTEVVITGTGFTGATAVDFGLTGPAASYEIDSDTQITAISPESPTAAVRHIRVTTAGGSSPAVPADKFTYTAPAPTITAVAPTSGTRDGGTEVVITGTGFTGATKVTFGTAGDAASFIVDSATQITAISPESTTTGIRHIRVRTAAGTSAAVSADRFTYTAPAPTVTAVTPSSGSTDGGTEVVITGTGFTGATKVIFGTAGNATSYIVDSATQITAISPPAASTGVRNIRVTAAGGTSPVVVADRYTYTLPAP
ncbi:IPT/TIG domain-containing protein [Nocardioides humilatus]|nr:IPT/TIG domain-containing protein [Nocardioides humilatus]